MVQVPVGLRLDEDLLRRVDEARGDVPRARWIARACEAQLALLGRGTPGGVVWTDENTVVSRREEPVRPPEVVRPLSRVEAFRRATQK